MSNDSEERSRKRQFLDALHLFISHHIPPFMNRCWRISFRGHTLYICARCSALVFGITVALIIQFFFFRIAVTPFTFFIAFLISLPAAIDWSTQTLFLRESRNGIRAVTGFLLGYAVGFALSSLNLLYYLLVVLLYTGYTLIFAAIAPFIVRRIHKWEDTPVTESSVTLYDVEQDSDFPDKQLNGT